MSASLLSSLPKLHTSALTFGLWFFLLLKSVKFSLFCWLFKYVMRKEHVLFLALLFSKGSRLTDHVFCVSSPCNNRLRTLCLRLSKGTWRSAYDGLGFFFRLATNNHLVQSAKRYTVCLHVLQNAKRCMVYLHMLRGVASLWATQDLFCYSNRKRKWLKNWTVYFTFLCILSLLVNTIILFKTSKSRKSQCSGQLCALFLIKSFPLSFGISKS